MKTTYEEVVSGEAKQKLTTLEIPSFLTSEKASDIPEEIDEISEAILNNLPGNTNIEEINHLNGIEKIAANLSDSEWQRYLYYAPSRIMTEELQRRLSGYEEETNAFVDIVDVVKKLKLIKKI